MVTLWNQRMDKNGLFTIGGSDVSTAHLKIPNEFIKCKSEFVGKQTISNLFGQKEVRAIGLLYDKNNAFSNFILTKKTPNIKIDDGVINELRNYLVDLVVYGDNACEKCSLFEKINNDFASKKYILREFPNSEKKIISLNRCAIETHGFLSEKFKLGNPTPGQPNDCSGPHFVSNDHISNSIITA